MHKQDVNMNNLFKFFTKTKTKNILKNLPIPFVRLIPFVIIVAPFSANNLTVSWWPSIAARSRHVRVWSFLTCNKWCCWIASKRILSTFLVGAVNNSVKVERFPWRVESNKVSVNCGIFICSINAARSCALFYNEKFFFKSKFKKEN